MARRKRERIVHSQSEAATHFGVSTTTIKTWLGQGCPGKAGRNGNPGRYDLDAIEQWRRERQGSAPDDPLLVGPNTPWMEKLREIKCKRERFAYRRDLGKWLPVDAVVQTLAVFASTIRQTFDTLQRQFGPEALAIVSGGVDDAEKIFRRGIGIKDVGDNPNELDSDDSESDGDDSETSTDVQVRN